MTSLENFRRPEIQFFGHELPCQALPGSVLQAPSILNWQSHENTQGFDPRTL